MATRQTSPASNPALNTRPTALAIAVAGALMGAPLSAFALPTGGEVAAGQASISRPSSSSLQIDQGTQKAILNWQGFSIGAAESVNFTQPSASAIALNRVLGNNPSEIFGRLSANGQIFLVNPSGVLFGRSASVDVGSLVATTLSISDQDFLAGRYVFSNAGGAGSVINEGSIITANGYTALMGPQVSNDGLIAARLGSVALAAADRVSLDMVGDGLISVSVDQAALNASAINSGRIEADGGNVLLTARSANALLDTVVNNSGIIRANSLVERNGEIVLDGGSSGITSVIGTLQVAGVDSGTTGGTVKVLGQYVGLFDNANINTSGDAGGGTVLVGGDAHGQGTVPHASYSYVSADSTITADALTNGNGGKVVVWADQVARYFGSISARGGLHGGDGGFVETSGLSSFVIAGSVDTSAPMGKAGMWLLDPFSDVNITTGVTTGTFDGAGVFTPNQDTAIVNNGTISTALETGDVTITTDNGAGTQVGNITVTDPVTRAAGGAVATTFTLLPSPAGSIVVSATGSISGSGGNPLNVNLAAAGGTVSVSAPITTFGGTFQSTGTTFTNPAGGPITTAGGTLTINQTGFVTISANLSSSGGDLSVTGVGITIPAAIVVNSGAGALSVNAGTGLLTTNALTDLLTTGTATLTADTMTLDATG